jgi:hypothetical protein
VSGDHAAAAEEEEEEEDDVDVDVDVDGNDDDDEDDAVVDVGGLLMIQDDGWEVEDW